jgi:hypothetical protein
MKKIVLLLMLATSLQAGPRIYGGLSWNDSGPGGDYALNDGMGLEFGLGWMVAERVELAADFSWFYYQRESNYSGELAFVMPKLSGAHQQWFAATANMRFDREIAIKNDLYYGVGFGAVLVRQASADRSYPSLPPEVFQYGRSVNKGYPAFRVSIGMVFRQDKAVRPWIQLYVLGLIESQDIDKAIFASVDNLYRSGLTIGLQF